MPDAATLPAHREHSALQARDVVCRRGRRPVLGGVSFTLAVGEVVALMGSNGAGKSTLLQVLAGTRRPASGEVSVLSRAAPWTDRKARGQIGFLPQRPSLYPEFSVRQQLLAAARLHGLGSASVTEEIAACGLQALAERPTTRLSAGERQRVSLAQALLHRPPVLLLDEPGSGLDPQQRSVFLERIRTLRGDRSILFASHHVEEAVAIADRVLVLIGGSIVDFGRLDGWQATVAVKLDHGASPLPKLRCVRSATAIGSDRYQLLLESGTSTAELAGELASAGIEWRELVSGPAAAEAQLLRLIAGGGP